MTGNETVLMILLALAVASAIYKDVLLHRAEQKAKGSKEDLVKLGRHFDRLRKSLDHRDRRIDAHEKMRQSNVEQLLNMGAQLTEKTREYDNLLQSLEIISEQHDAAQARVIELEASMQAAASHLLTYNGKD